MQKGRRMLNFLFLCCFGLFPFLFPILNHTTVHAEERLQTTNSPIIIVLDPGHGGDNNGTTENGFLEKEMNMTTAKACYEELSRFEGIKVYMTHWGDEDLTLKERAKYAAEKNADFLISIHYNASLSHELFGSEVWISLFPNFHNYGYQLGTEVLKEIGDMGVHLRGIKTKPHSNGKDYYGILREAHALNVPAMIVEHCHVDHPNDVGFCDSEDDLIAFGIADAHAIAKYYGLKSESAGLDYSDYGKQLANVTDGKTVSRAMYDETPPEECSIEVEQALYKEDKVSLLLTARDSQSNLIDYKYSLNGGLTFSSRIPLPDGDVLSGVYPDHFLLEIEIPDGTKPRICIQVFNPYDQMTQSNVLTFTEKFQKVIEVAPTEEPIVFEDATDTLFKSTEEDDENTVINQMLQVAKIVLPIIVILFLVFLVGYLIARRKNK